MWEVARQITPPVNQHARFPLGDRNATDAANRSLTRTTARPSAALDVGATAGEGEVVRSAVESLAPEDGAGAPVAPGSPEVQPAITATLTRTRAATRWPRAPRRPTRHPDDVRLRGTDSMSFPPRRRSSATAALTVPAVTRSALFGDRR